MKAICYSLFGHGKDYVNCFSFESYLSSLMLSIRFNRLVFPDWENVLQIDQSSYAAFEPFINQLDKMGVVNLEVNKDSPLCEAMLWRMKPIFVGKDEESKYTHILCRDLDSLHTFREAQAVQTWLNNGKAAHAITDSTSHNLPMLGGMIGFRPSEFKSRTGIKTFENFMSLNTYDMNVKGADQKFINHKIYPSFSEPGNDSITQHYFSGYGNTWLSDYHTCNCWLYNATVGHDDDCKENTSVLLSEELRETNEISEHMGAAGFNALQTRRLITKYEKKFLDLLELEHNYPDIFDWIKR